MPPKRQASVSSIAINTTSTNKFRPNAASDLVTKSQAALSSQASILQKTQNSQASQETNFNFNLTDHDDLEFNREEMSEVQISKEEEEVIHKILQVARKGKINSKNAFEIPIKVVSSEKAFSVNNKFWKFASELLSASMSIYDKRVENMYLSTGAFQNKLSRIGFQIKSRKEGEKDDQKHDDVHAEEDSKARQNRQERHNILKISVEDFSGALNLDDESIIGFQTLDRKEKLDIKNVENKFIADPTFERTQKMFDSFSLKSLMLNIFEVSTELDVRIFFQSDLEWQKLKETQKDRTQQIVESEKPQIQVNEGEEEEENGSAKTETETNKSVVEYEALKAQSGADPLPYFLLKHIEVSRNLINDNNFLAEIQNFTAKQPELKQDFITRNINYKNSFRTEAEEQAEEKLAELTYEQIIERERNEYSDIMKEFQGCYDEDVGAHHFQDIQDGEGLYETKGLSQSQSFENSHQLQFSQSILNRSFIGDTEANSLPSMPVSFQQNFFSWDDQNNIIEPIMPWEIEFKNLQLTRKMKKGSKNQKKQGKKNSKNSQTSKVDFELTIQDLKEVLAQKDTKKKFQSQKSVPIKIKERNTIGKEFDIVHSEYHSKSNNRSLNSRNSIVKVQNSMSSKQQRFDAGLNNEQNFILDFDHNPYQNQKQGDEKGNYDEQTRLMESENYPKNHSANLLLSEQKISKNTSYTGVQMGVNNIREIKAMIVSEINEKGRTTLDFMNKMLVNLSPQQLFTIFLHLTNEHQYQIFNQDGDQATIVLAKANRPEINARGRQNRNLEELDI